MSGASHLHENPARKRPSGTSQKNTSATCHRRPSVRNETSHAIPNNLLPKSAKFCQGSYDATSLYNHGLWNEVQLIDGILCASESDNPLKSSRWASANSHSKSQDFSFRQCCQGAESNTPGRVKSICGRRLAREPVAITTAVLRNVVVLSSGFVSCTEFSSTKEAEP